MGLWDDITSGVTGFGGEIAQATGLSDIKKGAEQFGSDVNRELARNDIRIDTVPGILNVASNYFTYGLVGVSETGQIQRGGTFRAVDEAVGELSGRNRARAAEAQQRGLLAAEEAKRAQELAQEQERRRRQDVYASQQAGLLTQQAGQQRAGYLGGSTGTDGLSGDFMGLS